MKKIAAMAEAEHILIAPHNPLGPIGSVATLHLSTCVPNFQIQEVVTQGGGRGVPWRDELIGGVMANRPIDGYLQLPPGPGLGIDLDEKVAEAHPYRRKPIPQRYTQENYYLQMND